MVGVIVVKTRADAAQQGFQFGSREQHIANELRGNGIPAVASRSHGIAVEHGTLNVECEEGTGLHVFTWTPAAPAEAPVAVADESIAVDDTQPAADDQQEPTTKKRGKKS